jgi:competence ComEA-like helix-hairpin-helix protein
VFTPDERRAFLFLMAVAASGGAVRLLRRGPDPASLPPAGQELSAGNVARQAALSRRALALAQPLRPGEQVDLDRAAADEIERLPRVGSEMARRIVADRDSNGPFGSLEGLGRVSGLGEATLRLIGPFATFSGVAVPAPPQEPTQPPPTSRRHAHASPCDSVVLPLALNAATAAQLACAPGIGPSLAERIVADRSAHGPFREVKELERVPGFGARRVKRLAPALRAP